MAAELYLIGGGSMTVEEAREAERARLGDDLRAAIEARHFAAGHKGASIFECTDAICSALAAAMTAL